MHSSHSQTNVVNGEKVHTNLELIQKVRELEIQMLDMKSQTDRRIQTIMEELPNKIDRDMKRLEKRDSDA